jgi:regulatory protein
VDALSVVTKLLSGRDKTRAQLHAALERKGFGPEEIDAALERARSLGYLDDARVAKRRALAELTAGWAGEALRARLEAVGVEGHTAQAAIDEAIAELGWRDLEAARRLLAVKKATGAKAARFLSSRGFSDDVVERLVGSPEVER